MADPDPTAVTTGFRVELRMGHRDRRSVLSLLRSSFVLALLGLMACDEADAHFTVTFASDFVPGRHSISLLGVYKDGRMSTGGWIAMEPYVSRSLGSAPCSAAYDALLSSNVPLAEALEAYAEANGPTDDLLDQLAPAAQGDLILLLAYAGALRQKDGRETGASPPSSSAIRRPGSRRRGSGGRTAIAPRIETDSATTTLELSASLYSIIERRSVAVVGLRYSGTSLDEAMTEFAAKLAQFLPQMHCAGWNWGASINADRIRQSVDE